MVSDGVVSEGVDTMIFRSRMQIRVSGLGEVHIQMLKKKRVVTGVGGVTHKERFPIFSVFYNSGAIFVA